MRSLVRLSLPLLAITFLFFLSSPAQVGSADFSISWGPELTLTVDSLNDGSPEILVSGDTIHLFWFEGDGPPGIIAHARSTDEGATFGTPEKILDIGVAGSWVTPQGVSFALAGGTPYVSGTSFTLDSALNFHNFIAVAGSPDGGASWGPFDPVNACPGFCYTATPGFAGYGATLFQLVTQYYVADTASLRVSVSTDAGASWGTPSPVPSGELGSRIRADAAGLHYAGSFPTDTTDELLYQRTTDLGGSWNGTILTPTYDGFADHPTLAVSGDGHVYSAWRGTLDGTPDGYAEHVSFRRSTDDGLTWGPHSLLCSSSAVEFPVLAAGGSVVALTWGNYATDSSDAAQVIAVSTDHGTTWSSLLPMPNVGWTSIAVSAGYLHHTWSENVGSPGTHQIHYRRGVVSPATGVDELMPAFFSLEQNYPNPFNGTTTIRYMLPARAPVSLRVFSMLGEQVGTLVDAVEAEGSHEVQWSPGPLAGGVYYYRIQAGTATGIGALLYIK